MEPAPIITSVKVDLPAELVAIKPEALAQAQDLAAKASALVPRNADDLVAANELFKAVDGLSKEIAKARLDLTRPLDDLKAKVIEAERQATAPLLAAKEALGKRMLACQAELNRIAAEERRKAEEEARRKAEEERARLEAERQERIARERAEHEERMKAAEEERKRLEAEAAEQAAMFGTPAAPVEAPKVEAYIEPEPVVVVPEVIKPTAPTIVAPKLAVRQVVKKVLKITDEAALLKVICEGGGNLYGRKAVMIDKNAIEDLLKAGCEVVGAKLEDDTGIASAGSRSAGKRGAA